MTDASQPIGASYRHCESLVREQDRDRYIASLFAPAERRPHLHALYAFDIEIARVGHVVREALAGEIRLQWWREALAGRVPDVVAGHPVAAALTETIARCALPPEPLERLIDVRALDLYDDPIATLDELASHARDSASTIFDLAARILDRDADVADVAGPAGIAATLVGSLQSRAHRETRIAIAPADLAARAREELERVRRHWHAVSPAAKPAFLPLALVRAELARARGGADPILPVRLAPWRRQWLLWRAARRGVF
jgi:phytoene synthase